MSTHDARKAVRASVRSFEEGLPKDKRKRLGQFFTGMPLGKLLAHLALEANTRSILDPMAGHGDLLDAAGEAAAERGIALERLDGIEIDDETADVCRDRLDTIFGTGGKKRHRIVCGSAFDPGALEQLSHRSYDLVITNPPYVRYQAQNGKGGQGESSRSGLEAIIEQRLIGAEKRIWKALAKGYSGLADLSVPAWLLAGLLVSPGGRLALVVPATWRSRDYGDVIRYLLLRCFQLECIVEDTQPGWFSDALVRTHLIVARRLPPQEAAVALESRMHWLPSRWLRVSPEAATAHSLVGAAFGDRAPEAACANWLSKDLAKARPGIQARLFNLQEESSSLKSRACRRMWYQELEGREGEDLPLFAAHQRSPAAAIPEALRDIVGDDFTPSMLPLEEAGIRVGQGLRTGCNWFFYVDESGSDGREGVRVKASSVLGNREFSVPSTAIRPVLRRQAELPMMERGQVPTGRVLDLRQWALPEDAPTIAEAKATYRSRGEVSPQIMPEQLADYVRFAATSSLPDQIDGKPVPELSAVRTNVRPHRKGAMTPRFWYMLPDFMPRHLPMAFVARVNHGTPRAESNLHEPILIDANFSTFWAPDGSWSPTTLKALLNSSWCQVFMEALGTPLGGGALKLEAAHLRQMCVPILSKTARAQLSAEVESSNRSGKPIQARIDRIVLGALCEGKPARAIEQIATMITDRAETLRRTRQRIAA